MSGLLVVLSGPGGVGKGTVAKKLVEVDPDLWLSRSWTTRVQRPGESDDAYTFVTREEFEAHLEAGGFIEYNDFLGNLYGTPVPDTTDGKDILLEIDVNGARQVREIDETAFLIFLIAPSAEEQHKRLVGRGDTPEHVAERLAKAEREADMAAELDAVTVVNDKLDETVAEILDLINQARANPVA